MRFDEAIKYANLAIELKKKIGFKNFSSLYGILARANDGLKNIEDAETFYK